MVFTTQLFTFVFLPILFAVYFLAYFLQKKCPFLQKVRATDLILVAFSAVFYLWACFDDLFPFITYILIVYFMGRSIQRMRDRKYRILLDQGDETPTAFPIALLFTLAACAVVTAILVHFKGGSLATDFWNFLMKDTATPKSVVAPLGISFISFSAISYLVDIYKGKANAGSFLDCLLFLSFFPKVVSGPIVLWRDFEPQRPHVSLAKVSDGMTRVMIGFAKKVILADTFGACIAKTDWRIDAPIAWGMGLLYMLQIYFDFSGYSDIAIGLAKLLGYDFQENFNFPYLSTSIGEFWRRWHISLGRWFREYIYFPLGGSRRGTLRTVINIAVVFILTGLWHGAGWTYMLWGAINGLCNIIERLMADKKFYVKTPKIIKWFFTMAITFFCWQLFRAPTIDSAIDSIKTMFGQTPTDGMRFFWSYYFDHQIITFAIIGILGSTVFGLPKVQEAYQKILRTKAGYLVHQIMIVLLFVLAILFMVNSTYSPFLYFQY